MRSPTYAVCLTVVSMCLYNAIIPVASLTDSIGLHRIENSSHTDPAISLHLYCPPITRCHIYDERSGRSHACSVSFYSKQGMLCSNYTTCAQT